MYGAFRLNFSHIDEGQEVCLYVLIATSIYAQSPSGGGQRVWEGSSGFS